MALHVSERKQLYALLAHLFTYPDQETLDAVAREGRAAVALVPEAGAPPADDELRALEIAYTALFINRLGGAPALPYGSVYMQGEELLMGESTLRVAELYKSEGLTLEGSGEPPDHLPTELEFLYYLVSREEAALQRRETAAACQAGERQAIFCRNFLHPWVHEFCRRIAAEKDAHPLYLWGGKLLENFCRMEKDWLDRLHPPRTTP